MWWAITATGLVLVAAGVGLLLWNIDQPGPASVGEAVDRFREQEGGEGPAGARPPEGVYLYEGEGREHLSFPPLTQRDGARMPGTVTHEAGGCWVFRLDYNAEHWQDWRYCPEGDAVAELGGHTHQTWDLGVTTVENLTTFVCDPPAVILPPAAAGTEVDHRCRGRNTEVEGSTTSEGPWTYVGPETLAVGEDEADALHFTRDRVITGAQHGTEHLEVWFRADGLLLRMDREIEVRSPSPIGDITYTESGELALTELAPER
jgi:hypothetical protein